MESKRTVPLILYYLPHCVQGHARCLRVPPSGANHNVFVAHWIEIVGADRHNCGTAISKYTTEMNEMGRYGSLYTGRGIHTVRHALCQFFALN
jgi:hypothetical protein